MLIISLRQKIIIFLFITILLTDLIHGYNETISFFIGIYIAF